MNAVAWIVLLILAALLAFFVGQYRLGIRDRHNLAQFAFLLMLHPDVYQVQRDNFLRLLKRLNARNRTQLGGMVLIALSDHAAKVTSDLTLPNSEAMWEINQGVQSKAQGLYSIEAKPLKVKHSGRGLHTVRPSQIKGLAVIESGP